MQKQIRLSEKDITLIKLTYRKVSENFYQNSNPQTISQLICVLNIIKNVLKTSEEVNQLSLTPMLEILKVKSKNYPSLSQYSHNMAVYLSTPINLINIDHQYLTQGMNFAHECPQLYTLSCTILSRLPYEYQSLLTQQTVSIIGNNCTSNMNLSVELLLIIVSIKNDFMIKALIRSGMVKYLLKNYLIQLLQKDQNKLFLYRSLKLLNIISLHDKNLVKDREKYLSKTIYKYQQYVPIIKEILTSCYDTQYSNTLFTGDGSQWIQKLYLWTHIEILCIELANQNMANNLIKILTDNLKNLKKNNGQYNQTVVEVYIYTIFANIGKYAKIYHELQNVPIVNSTEALKPLLKLLLLQVQNNKKNISTKLNGEFLKKLEDKADKSSDPTVPKFFQQLVTTLNAQDQKAKHLNRQLLDIFSQKNAQLLMQNASRRPLNKQQLQRLIQILDRKQGKNQFQIDNLNKAKKSVIQNTLETILSTKSHLITPEFMNNVAKTLAASNQLELINRFLQVMQIYLLKNESDIDKIDSQGMRKLVQKLQNQDKKNIMIDWNACSQVMKSLYDLQQWKSHIQNIFNGKECHWLLAISQPNQKEKDILDKKIATLQQLFDSNPLVRQKFMIILGFLSKIPELKDILQKRNFQQLLKKFYLKTKLPMSPNNYLMTSYMLNDWQTSNKKLILQKQIIPQLFKSISNELHTEQVYELLNKCLPINYHSNQPITSALPYQGQLAHSLIEQYQDDYEVKKHMLTNIYECINNQSNKLINIQAYTKPQNLVEILKYVKLNSDKVIKEPISIFIQKIVQILKKMTNMKEYGYGYWKLYPYYVIIMKYLLESLIEFINKCKDHNKIREVLQNLYRILYTVIMNKQLSNEQFQEIFDMITNFLSSPNEDILLALNIDTLRVNCQQLDPKYQKDFNAMLDKMQVQQNIVKDKYKKNVEMLKKQDKKITLTAKQNINEKKFIQKKIQLVSQEVNQAPKQSQIFISKYQPHEDINSPKKMPIGRQRQSLLEQQDQNINIESIPEHQIKHLSQNEKTLLHYLRQLQKISQKKQSPEKLSQGLNFFRNNFIPQKYRSFLGYLLAKAYYIKQEYQILQLLLHKDKTNLSKNVCYELLENFIEAFILSHRWKFIGRQWIILAMDRLVQEKLRFVAEAMMVIEYNLIKTSDIQFFESKKTHKTILEMYKAKKIIKIQDYEYFMLLIGTSSRLNDLRMFYIKENAHVLICKLMGEYYNNEKILANGSYANSSLIYLQVVQGLKIAKMKQQFLKIFEGYKIYALSKSVIESGMCLISNVTYSNEQAKLILYNYQLIPLLIYIFQSNLKSQESQLIIFKHILRAIGNCSISRQCAEQIIDSEFPSLSIKFIEKYDIVLLNYSSEIKTKVLKLFIDLIANLTIHKHNLMKLHSNGMTKFIINLLETSELNPELIMGCIDTIDGLCQERQIQTYAVTQKNLPYILIDILKMQQNEKVITKSTRLLTNLTIHQQCIPAVLEANLLSILANIVLPNRKNKKIETYTNKIIVRVYNAQPKIELVLKSGYFHCLVKSMETSEVLEDSHVDIMLFYSKYLPNFLNKGAFMCLIRVLTEKVVNKQLMQKCIKIFKTLLNMSVDKDEEDTVIEGSPKMYEHLIQKYPIDAVFLMGSHCLRSKKLRVLLRNPQICKIPQLLTSEQFISQSQKLLNNDDKAIAYLKEMVSMVLFAIYNDAQSLIQQYTPEQQQKAYQVLNKGIKCKLFRTDGSSKKAIVQINEDYALRAYKYPDGEIKKKYVLPIRHIKDWHFHYADHSNKINEQLWKHSIFHRTAGKSFFDQQVKPGLCVTLMGGMQWGQFVSLNLQFQTEQLKNSFIICICILMTTFAC